MLGNEQADSLQHDSLLLLDGGGASGVGAVARGGQTEPSIGVAPLGS